MRQLLPRHQHQQQRRLCLLNRKTVSSLHFLKPAKCVVIDNQAETDDVEPADVVEGGETTDATQKTTNDDVDQ